MKLKTDYGNKAAYGDLQFGLNLMSHLGKGNVSISPASVRTALAMLYEGAAGETARQIASAAMLPEYAPARHEGFKELATVLNPVDVPYTSRFANGLWVNQKFPVNPDFKQTLTSSYGAEAQAANFGENPEGERLQINGWVSKKTEGKITELFPPGSFGPLTAIALANALYFKASWIAQFNPALTQKQDFMLASGEIVKVDMMRKGDVDYATPRPRFLYGELDEVQMVLLPYKGNKLGKMVLLPPKGSSATDLEAYLKDQRISSMRHLYLILESEVFTRLEIPKHEVRGNYDLEAPLSAEGIDRIWSFDLAELSGIGPGPLAVTKGIHQTYFKTNEEGSEGAAATGFAVTRGFSMVLRTVDFVADRPFLEAIVNLSTGSLLFLNRIEDPR